MDARRHISKIMTTQGDETAYGGPLSTTECQRCPKKTTAVHLCSQNLLMSLDYGWLGSLIDTHVGSQVPTEAFLRVNHRHSQLLTNGHRQPCTPTDAHRGPPCPMDACSLWATASHRGTYISAHGYPQWCPRMPMETERSQLIVMGVYIWLSTAMDCFKNLQMHTNVSPWNTLEAHSHQWEAMVVPSWRPTDAYIGPQQ